MHDRQVALDRRGQLEHRLELGVGVGVLEHRSQMRPVDLGALRQLRLGHLAGLAALVEVPHDHRRGEALDPDDPEAQAVEDPKHLPQHRGELGEAEQPLELLRLHADELRRTRDRQPQTLDPALHLT
ncbi:hypothetical protein [Nannocystis radixulma]|uniref:Uncharacterized protein n=1 Tax=Nannocystis radixulma TaxID=2995305 RepID=A0ABT5BAR6_9BACT|nr:hypothetical protein [Nannocystis radixulma]MDC0670538.1 hypothetical protein [Nannocystis radixulma]